MPISDLTGTKWIIRYAPTLQPRQFLLNFISNGTNYHGFIMQDSIAHGLYYLDSLDQTTQVYDKSSNTWTNSAYRIIEITGGTDATNETLIVWLGQNATQVPVVDLTGTKWIINETPNVDLMHDCHLDFISKGTNFELFKLDDDIFYDTVHAYNLNSNPKWANQAYRTIEIVGGADTSYPDLLMWLAQNATQIFVTDLRGTKWIFNNIADPNYESGSGTELHCSNLIFVSNNTNFTSLHVHDNSDIDREEISYDNTLVYIIWDYGGNPNWYNQAYRTIEIIGGTDASNVTLIAWLTRNATQVPVINLSKTKWVLNADLVAYPGVKYYYLNFRSNNRTFSTLAFDGHNNAFLRYGADNIYRFGIESAGWVDAAYQIIEIKGGADVSNKDLLVWLAQHAEYQEPELEPEPAGFKNVLFGALEIDKITFGPLNVDKIYMGQTLVWQAGPVIDPILNNNSWTVIAQVCNAGQAENYWALGDTKTDLGTDGVTRTFRICDMQGLYDKNAVFEQVELTETAVVWNPRTTTSADDEGCCNNYGISNMRFTELPVLFTKYSLELQNIITNTTYKVAKNGLTNSILDLTDKLFLPAEREIFASRSSSTQTEWNALTRFALYALPENDNADFRKKFKPSTPSSADFYWERSPQSDYDDYACEVSSSGSSSATLTEDNDRIAPCFALGSPAPIVIDPILENNSWETIAQICDAGEAANYWALGDIKTDLGVDGTTRTFRICDMSGMYGKNAVFEQMETEANGVVWNSSSNKDDNDCYNNYNISNIRNTVLPALLANYSLELQAVISNTTYKVAKNGTVDPIVLLNLSDKLFLPAEGEIFGTRAYSAQEEWNALKRFTLYALPENDKPDFRKKRDSTSTLRGLWERSPYFGNAANVCTTSSGHAANYGASHNNFYIAPCFALGFLTPTTSYEIGFRGMSNSNPALTRTGEAVGATWAATSGVISIDGIDLTKIFGGYVGNDGEELTWDSVNSKYLHNGAPYTGNVFTKINRFFTKAHYEGAVLDGYDLCFAPSAPDNTYQDWFLGKDHCIIGCYKACGGMNNGLQSKQGLNNISTISANDIVTAYKLNSSTSYNLHEKWYNENAILQVLFMALFATRQTSDVFPEATYRDKTNDTRATGYMDSYRAQSLFAYEPTGDSGKRGNMFLGIEDFIGWGYELVAGAMFNSTNIYTSLDYENFIYSGSYARSDLYRPTTSYFFKELQQSNIVAGLLVPKTSGGSATTYFCDYNYYATDTKVWYQGARDQSTSAGLFCFSGNTSAGNLINNNAARLCGTPK